MTPKISIIIPIYNSENYLSECLESVINQTFHDFEIIAVNDGSTDKSGEICQAYVKRDYRIKVIDKSNGGVSSARNAGLDAATGDYIGFVDSDDVIHPEMYSRLYEIASETNADIVQCSHTRNSDSFICRKTPYTEIYDNIEALRRIYTRNYTNSIALWSKIFRRGLFSNIKFPVGIVYEDDEVVPELIYKSTLIAETDDVLYCYIKRISSIVTSPGFDKIKPLTETLVRRTEKFALINDELGIIAEKHLLHYLKIKAVNSYKCKEGLNPENSDYFLHMITSFKCLRKVSDKYDKIYRIILKSGFKPVKKWILENDFEPIQKAVGRICKRKYQS